MKNQKNHKRKLPLEFKSQEKEEKKQRMELENSLDLKKPLDLENPIVRTKYLQQKIQERNDLMRLIEEERVAAEEKRKLFLVDSWFQRSLVNLNEDGNTKLHATVSSKNYLEAFSLLEKKEVPVNAQNLKGETALHRAISLENLPMLGILLAFNADMEVKNLEGETPLHLAVSQRKINMTKFLLGKDVDETILGTEEIAQIRSLKDKLEPKIDIVIKNQPKANIEAKNHKGETPLHLAISLGATDIIELLLEEKANMLAINREEKTALCLAIKNISIDVSDRTDIVGLLLNHGADIKPDHSGSTALHYAAEIGDVEVMAVLLKRVADLHKKAEFMSVQYFIALENSDGRNALHLAILNAKKNTDTAEYLLKHRANVDAPTRSGFSPLSLAVAKENVQLTNWLLDNGASADFRDPDSNTPLHVAIIHDNFEIMKLIVDFREMTPNVNTCLSECNNDGNDAWLLAAEWGRLNIIQWLCAKPINKKVRNKKGYTALLLSALEPMSLSVMQWLLCGGFAKCDERDGYDNTAFLLAAQMGNLKAMQWLLKNGYADLAERNKNGNTALSLATSKAHFKVVQWLIEEQKVDFSQQNGAGNTPLQLAIMSNGDAIAKWLIENNYADLEQRNVEGDTLLLVAVNSNKPDIVKLLLEQKADINAVNEYTQCSVFNLITSVEMRNLLNEYKSESSSEQKRSSTTSMSSTDNKYSLPLESKRFDPSSSDSNLPEVFVPIPTHSNTLSQSQVEQLFANFCRIMSGIDWKLMVSIESNGNKLYSAVHQMQAGFQSYRLTERLHLYIQGTKSDMTFEVNTVFDKSNSPMSCFNVRFITPDSLRSLQNKENKIVQPLLSISSTTSFLPPPRFHQVIQQNHLQQLSKTNGK